MLVLENGYRYMIGRIVSVRTLRGFWVREVSEHQLHRAIVIMQEEVSTFPEVYACKMNAIMVLERVSSDPDDL